MEEQFLEDELGPDKIEVVGPSGSKYEVIHEKEKDYWDTVAQKYLDQFSFKNISDLQDLEKVLVMELLYYRYSQWVSLERDYWGADVDVEATNEQAKKISTELRLLKKNMGIDKASRDKDKEQQTVADYIDNLRKRAQEFGVMRNEQAIKSITLWNELVALLTFFDNMDEQERKDNHLHEADVLNWIREVGIPEYNKIDEAFRQEQKYWVADL